MSVAKMKSVRLNSPRRAYPKPRGGEGPIETEERRLHLDMLDDTELVAQLFREYDIEQPRGFGDHASREDLRCEIRESAYKELIVRLARDPRPIAFAHRRVKAGRPRDNRDWRQDLCFDIQRAIESKSISVAAACKLLSAGKLGDRPEYRKRKPATLKNIYYAQQVDLRA